MATITRTLTLDMSVLDAQALLKMLECKFVREKGAIELAKRVRLHLGIPDIRPFEPSFRYEVDAYRFMVTVTLHHVDYAMLAKGQISPADYVTNLVLNSRKTIDAICPVYQLHAGNSGSFSIWNDPPISVQRRFSDILKLIERSKGNWVYEED